MPYVKSDNFTVVEKSDLFDILKNSEILSSTEKIINDMRTNLAYKDIPISNRAIKLMKGSSAIKYKNSHICIPYVSKDLLEIWDGNTYIHPLNITWINDNNQYLYGILNTVYPDGKTLKVYINKNVVSRFNEKSTTPKIYYLSLKKSNYSYISNIKDAIYAIVDGVLKKVTLTSETSTDLLFNINYNSSIDIFVCRNLLFQGINLSNTILVDKKTSKLIPGTFIVNNDDSASIDVKFYPYVKLSSTNNFLRIFSNKKVITENTRMIASPEYNYITGAEPGPIGLNLAPENDPYNPTFTYLKDFVASDEVISHSDDDSTILTKLTELSKEYYNRYSVIRNADHRQLLHIVSNPFVEKSLTTQSGTAPAYISVSNVNPLRDIIFYDGEIFTDYTLKNLNKLNEFTYEEKITGSAKYVVAKSVETPYDLTKFSILKTELISNNDAGALAYKLKGKDIVLNDIFFSKYDNILAINEVTNAAYNIPINSDMIKVTLPDENDNADILIIGYPDVFINFKEYKCATKYNSIIVNLINDGIVSETDFNVFYKRLLTSKDTAEVDIMNKKVSKNNIINLLKTKQGQNVLMYSKNILRLSLEFPVADINMNNHAANHVLYLKNLSSTAYFSYIKDRMPLFINGKLIDPKNIDDTNPDILVISDFTENIETVDILYQETDIDFMTVRRALINSYYDSNPTLRDIGSVSLTNMEYITMPTEETHRGFYDILYDDYLKDGRIVNILMEIGDDPEKLAKFKQSLLDNFSEISAKNVYGSTDSLNKILISTDNVNGEYYYEIKSGEA